MNLLLMRHGAAESIASSDYSRLLTGIGRQQVEASGIRLRQREIHYQVVVSSPFPRARETAEIMAVADRISPSTLPDLTPDGEPGDVFSALGCYMVASPGVRQASGVLVVTHQPLIGEMIFMLTGEKVLMSTANVAVIRTEVVSTGCGELLCVI